MGGQAGGGGGVGIPGVREAAWPKSTPDAIYPRKRAVGRQLRMPLCNSGINCDDGKFQIRMNSIALPRSLGPSLQALTNINNCAQSKRNLGRDGLTRWHSRYQMSPTMGLMRGRDSTPDHLRGWRWPPSLCRPWGENYGISPEVG